METTLLRKNGTAQISDFLEICIVDLINAMRADYGNKFLKQFSDTEVLRQYKRRLYAKLRDVDVKEIYLAYDEYVESSNQWPPTVPEILTAIKNIQKIKRSKQRLQEEAKRIEHNSALPKTQRLVNPIELLKEAKEDVKNKSLSHDQVLKRKHLAWLELKKCVAGVPISYADNNHLCCVDSCCKPGNISSSSKGSEFWYCSDHYAKRN